MNDHTLLFATYLASADYKMYQYVTNYVEQFTGIPSFLLNGEALDDFSLGYIDAGFIAASDYAYLTAQFPNPVERIASPVLLETSFPHKGLIGDNSIKIIVRRESPCREVADLQECVFSYCFRSHRTSGDTPVYQSLEQILLACNACPFGISIKNAVETCSYMHALRLVLDGDADAAVIEAGVLDLILRNNASLARGLRELGVYNVSRASDVVVSTHLHPRIKHTLREAFRTIHQQPSLAQYLLQGSIERFLVIEPEPILPADHLAITPITLDPAPLAADTHIPEHAYAYTML